MLIPEHDFSIANSPFPAWVRGWQPVDPGWLYIIRNHNLFKVGKTTHPERRLREARTWLPHGELVGMKPFWTIHQFERTLLCGIADCWADGEWHRAPDEEWAVSLEEDFRMFDDHDRNKNTIDFGYWISGSGMAELIMEQNWRRISLRRWQREA